MFSIVNDAGSPTPPKSVSPESGRARRYAPRTCALAEAEFGCACDGCRCGQTERRLAFNTTNATNATVVFTEAPCDDPAWHKRGATHKDCPWVAAMPAKRCTVVGEDDRLAQEGCTCACRREDYRMRATFEGDLSAFDEATRDAMAYSISLSVASAAGIDAEHVSTTLEDGSIVAMITISALDDEVEGLETLGTDEGAADLATSIVDDMPDEVLAAQALSAPIVSAPEVVVLTMAPTPVPDDAGPSSFSFSYSYSYSRGAAR